MIRFVWPICVLLLPALVGAQETEPRLGAKEAAIEAALDQETVFDFTDAPLSAVVEFVKQQYQIQIQLDNKALADAGVGSDTTITRNLHDVKLSSALDLLLGELELTFVIRDEVLMITTKAEAENILSTRVYPVADLVTPLDDDLLIGGRSEFRVLIELIDSAIKPESWDETGGPGVIKEHPKSLSLVISQTYEVHREISTLLKSLRAVDRRLAEQRLDAYAPVADGDEGLQLKVYKLPAIWLVANPAPLGNPNAPPATQPATVPAAGPDGQKPATSPAAPMPQMVGGMGGGGMGGFAVGRINPAAATELARSIPDLIEPESWEGAGGSGVIRAVHGTLVVRQTADVHRQIRRLLQALN